MPLRRCPSDSPDAVPPRNIDVGVGGGILNDQSGTTVVVFGEGRAFAFLEFNSKTGERVPAEVAIGIAKVQDATIKAGVK